MSQLNKLVERLIASRVEFVLIGGFAEVKKRSIELTIPAGICRVLDIDALIAAKAATNRTRDRMTISQLTAIKERQGL